MRRASSPQGSRLGARARPRTRDRRGSIRRRAHRRRRVPRAAAATYRDGRSATAAPMRPGRGRVRASVESRRRYAATGEAASASDPDRNGGDGGAASVIAAGEDIAGRTARQPIMVATNAHSVAKYRGAASNTHNCSFRRRRPAADHASTSRPSRARPRDPERQGTNSRVASRSRARPRTAGRRGPERRAAVPPARSTRT